MPENHEAHPPSPPAPLPVNPAGAPQQKSRGHGTGLRIACVGGSLLAIAVIITWLTDLARSKRSEGARRCNCMSHIRQIGIALHVYAGDNDSNFPSNLARLHPTYANDPIIFSCASAPSSWEDFLPGGKVTETSSSYTYVPGLNSFMPGAFIVAYDKKFENHRKGGSAGGRNVLFVNAAHSWWPTSRETELGRRLALQAEAVEKWRASGKPAKDIDEFISPELREMMGRW